MRKPSGASEVRVLSIYNGARDEKYRYYPRGPRDLSVRLFVGCIWALFVFLIIYIWAEMREVSLGLVVC